MLGAIKKREAVQVFTNKWAYQELNSKNGERVKWTEYSYEVWRKTRRDLNLSIQSHSTLEPVFDIVLINLLSSSIYRQPISINVYGLLSYADVLPMTFQITEQKFDYLLIFTIINTSYSWISVIKQKITTKYQAYTQNYPSYYQLNHA